MSCNMKIKSRFRHSPSYAIIKFQGPEQGIIGSHRKWVHHVYVQICKDLKKNLHSQPTQFYEYVYYESTSFGPKLGPSSGHNNTRKWIHLETEIIKQEISRCTPKYIKNIYVKKAR
jgi:hypothetical protein